MAILRQISSNPFYLMPLRYNEYRKGFYYLEKRLIMKIKDLIKYQNKHTKTELVKGLDNKALVKLTIVNYVYQQDQVYALIDNNTNDYEQISIDELTNDPDSYLEIKVLGWINEFDDQFYLLAGSFDDLEDKQLYARTVMIKAKCIASCEFIAM